MHVSRQKEANYLRMCCFFLQRLGIGVKAVTLQAACLPLPLVSGHDASPTTRVLDWRWAFCKSCSIDPLRKHGCQTRLFIARSARMDSGRVIASPARTQCWGVTLMNETAWRPRRSPLTGGSLSAWPAGCIHQRSTFSIQSN